MRAKKEALSISIDYCSIGEVDTVLQFCIEQENVLLHVCRLGLLSMKSEENHDN
jgi:hypothetical protein